MHWIPDPQFLFFGSLVAGLAALVRRVTGFGFAMVSVGLLSLFVHPVEAVAITLFLVAALSVRNVGLMRGSANWGLAIRLALFGAIGVPLGVAFAHVADENVLRIGIGTVVMTSVIPMMLKPPRVSSGRNLPVALSGLAAGVLNASAAIPAPPLLIYLMARSDVSLECRRATLIAIFTLLSLIALTGHILGGTVHLSTVRHALLFLPATVLGDELGRRMAWAQSRQVVDRLSIGVVAISSLMLWVSAIL